MRVDQNSHIRLVCDSGYGLAPVVGIARTPSFVACFGISSRDN